MTFCARAKKKTGPTFFGERSVVGGGSLARRKKDRFARRCDDAFCWNAPNNKLSFLFFFLPRRIFIGVLLVAVWRIISLTDDASNERKRKCKAPKIH